MNFELLAVTLYVIFVIAIFIFFVCLLAFFVDFLLDKRASRWMKTTRFNPDHNGNRPYFFHFRTGYSYEPESGNQEALSPNFVNGLLPTQLDTTPSKGKRGSLSVSANTQPAAFFVEEIDIPVNSQKSVNRGLPDSNQDLQPLQLGKFTDLLPKMADLIQEGRTKTDILSQLGLVGRHYKAGSEFYEKVLLSLTTKAGGEHD